MKNYKDIAHDICNTINVVDHYPLIYQTAWNIQYKGKATQSQIKEVNKLQGEDVRKFNYVPIGLLNQLKSILQ